MANQEHLDLLNQGVEAWNQWRKEHTDMHPDLSGADLSRTPFIGADFSEADLSFVNLSEANLYQTNFTKANLTKVNLTKANLHEASFYQANLHEADLSEASLGYAHLTYANLAYANLIKADLRRSSLVDTNLSYTNLTNCSVYRISVWNVRTDGAIQDDLVITRRDEPIITVDNLEVAQFIYLLLNNQKIRQVVSTLTSKVVLILGNFSDERKRVLDALRVELRKHNYLPVLFDFEKPAGRDLTETISTLAHMARFVIADITDAKSIPQELSRIVPNLPSVAVQPLILKSQHEYGMFEHFARFPWVLPVYHYTDEVSLLKSLREKVIVPTEQKAKELERLWWPTLSRHKNQLK